MDIIRPRLQKVKKHSDRYIHHYKDLSSTITEAHCVLETKAAHAYHLKCVEDDPKCKSVSGVTGPCNKLSYLDTTKAFLLM